MGKHQNVQDHIIFEDKNDQYGFTQVPNVVLTSTVLSPTAVRIYTILRRYASMPKGAMPSVPTICVEANISKATYNREIKTFIRSTENPNPAVPLISVIHRPNKSNIFKVHKLTEQLIAKLKPAVAMEKVEVEKLKAKYKRKSKKKSASQNETPFENTRESQNETHLLASQNETPGVSNCDTSNIENKLYRQTNGDCLIDFQTKQEAEKFISHALQKGMSIKSVQATKKRYLEAREKRIEHKSMINALDDAFERYGNNTSPISVIQTEIDNRIAAEEAEKTAMAEAAEKEKRRKQNADRLAQAMIAAGLEGEIHNA